MVSDFAFRTFPERSESELSKIRSAVVSGQALAEVAREIDLGRYLLLGKGEDQTGGRDRPSILCDAMEALFAAVFLDGGLDAVTAVIHGLLADRITEAAEGPGSGEGIGRVRRDRRRAENKKPARGPAGFFEDGGACGDTSTTKVSMYH